MALEPQNHIFVFDNFGCIDRFKENNRKHGTDRLNICLERLCK